jgi:anion-transporting  ArsA/GET3 family ATPase
MDVQAFCRQANVVVVVGKGGVGKTTVTATLAVTAARHGLDVLIASLDEGGGLPSLFGLDDRLSYEEVLLSGSPAAAGSSTRPGTIRARLLTSDAALIEYLAGHGLGRVSRRLAHSGALDVVATAIPGIREILVLGKLRSLETTGAADLIILDAPASGHAVSLFTSPGGLLDATRGGPLRGQAEQVVELLGDPARCQVLLVTLAEETPVNEVIETAYRLEDEVGVSLGPVVVNGCFTPLDLPADAAAAAAAAGLHPPDAKRCGELERAAAFRRSRQSLQHDEIVHLARELPLPQIRLPYQFAAELGTDEIEDLADALTLGITQL